MSLLSDEQSHRPSASEVLQFELFQKKQTNKPYYPNIADMFKTFKVRLIILQLLSDIQFSLKKD